MRREREVELRGRDSRDRDRGASLIESAIVLPLLILLALGTIDLGMLFRHHHSLTSAVRVGVRVGALSGKAEDADWLIIQSVLEGRSTLDASSIRRIVVFDAIGDDGEMDPGCKTASMPGCNLYVPSHFAMSRSAFLASGASASWPPAGRRASAFGDTDHVGVWVESDFHYVTGIFGAQRTVSEVAVMKIDPSAGDIMPSGVTLPPPPPNTTVPTPTTAGPSGPSSTTATTKKPKTPKTTTTTSSSSGTTAPPTTTGPTTTTLPPSTTSSTTTTTTFQRGLG